MESPQNGRDKERKINTKLFLSRICPTLGRTIDLAIYDKKENKDLVVLPEMRPLLDFTVERELFAERNISLVWLNQATLKQYNDSQVKYIIFLMPSTEEALLEVDKFIRMLTKQKFKKNLFIIFYPARNIEVKNLMDIGGFTKQFGDAIYDYNFDLLPLGQDLLSLERLTTTKELFIDFDYTSLNLVAESLIRLQMVFGRVNNYLIKGNRASSVYQIMERMLIEQAESYTFEEGRY